MTAFRTPSHALSPEAQRAERRVAASEVLRAARERAGMTTLALAAEAGCKQQHVQKQEDPSDPHNVLLETVMSPSIATHTIRLLAVREGMIVFEIPEAADGSAAHMAVAEISRETADVVSSACESFADGLVTRAEVALVRTQIREAVEALLRFDASLEQLGDEQVASVHSIGGKR